MSLSQEEIEVVKIVSELLQQPVSVIAKDFENFKKESENMPSTTSQECVEPIERSTTQEYPYTIYYVIHNLKMNDVAYGKNTGLEIRYNDSGDVLIDQKGNPVKLSKHVMNDIYYIEKIEKTITLSFEEAKKEYLEGNTIYLDSEDNSYVINKEKTDLAIPLSALFNGVFLTHKKSI